MKHYILINWHQLHLPGIRDLIENLRNDERFEVSHWNSKTFIDPKKNEYKSYSLFGNFQKLDSLNYLPLAVEDHELINIWSEIRKPRVWISSMIDLHLGINKMMFGKETNTRLDAEKILSNFFDSIAWAYEHNSFDYVLGNSESDLWKKKLYKSLITSALIRDIFKSRLDFPWAVSNQKNHNSPRKIYDFCIPGAQYPTRIEMHEFLKADFKIAPYILTDGLITRFVSGAAKLSPKIRNNQVLYRGKLREINMNKLIKMSKFAYVDGSKLQYFVRKHLEVVSLETTMICPESNPLTMYGFKKNLHYIEKNEFILNPTGYLEQFKDIQLRQDFVANMIYDNHTFEVRTNQLYRFLEGLLRNDYCYGGFNNGLFFISSNKD
ncbi:hypothetical protein EBU94_01730 [bacterium]|nr:hypothetical protein [bacterium]